MKYIEEKVLIGSLKIFQYNESAFLETIPSKEGYIHFMDLNLEFQMNDIFLK